MSEVNKKNQYTAQDIEVLEGLEPVRLRPGMYVGGTDLRAMHHLVTEVLDNAMDEAVAGHATKIVVHLQKGNVIKIEDNGRGIPIDPHPKYPVKSALEVIFTTLHSGGKFSGDAYHTSGGLHGVGVSVVNALSDRLEVSVTREGHQYTQLYSRGIPISELSSTETSAKGSGTSISFHPDPQIFGDLVFVASTIYKLCRSRGYLYPGVQIMWVCDTECQGEGGVPLSETIHYPNGIEDYVRDSLKGKVQITSEIFKGSCIFQNDQGRVEWAMAWIEDDEPVHRYYCNTVHTDLGGTHEVGFKAGLLKGIKTFAEFTSNSKVSNVTSEDILASAIVMVSVFIRNPIFQGQTKNKLLSVEVQRLVENAVKSSFEDWLVALPGAASEILELILQYTQQRLDRRKAQKVSRKSPIKSLRLPGKLADCADTSKKGSELFLVEGDSAGGSAKQARDRQNQAILPLKGKILNVASASIEKIMANAEIRDLIIALGCGVGAQYNSDNLRYEKIIIMTDADVDGAHISTLLMTFFYMQMPKLILDGHLYLAQPPLYKIATKRAIYYAANDKELQSILKKLGSKQNPMISRFKGLGEMTAAQLKETTMDRAKRTLLQVTIRDAAMLAARVEQLMGRDPESRYNFIQSYMQTVEDIYDIADL